MTRSASLDTGAAALNLNAAAAAAAASAGGAMPSPMPSFGSTSRCMIAFIVYLALLLDNVLLTVIVPILPDYLASINNRSAHAPLERDAAVSNGLLLPATSSLSSSSSSQHSSASASSSSSSASGVGLGVFGNSLAQQFAYRNQYDGQPSSLSSSSSSSTSAKHPIPGKSMVNFSLLHVGDDNKLFSAPILTASGSGGINSIGGGGGGGGGGASTKGSMNANYGGSNARRARMSTLNGLSVSSESLASENGSIGVLLAMKALVQLIFNPIVGNLSSKLGYRLPIVVGTFCLLMASLVFAVGETYWTLLIARAVHGIGAACIGVCGMSLVAQHYPEEDRRSRVMGVILGSIALGVLIGYPFGGIMYDLMGKSAPFIILSTVIFLSLGMQLIVMDLSVQPEVMVNVDEVRQQAKWKPLLQNRMILAIVIAIWISTSSMAILEPCLPIWLIQYLKPTKWQLGTVFIPDSVGYFVGTNFFGGMAYRYGQVKISFISLLLVGISAILIPSTTTVAQLLLPHFGLGLGIGIIDSALVPLLATFVDATLTHEELAVDVTTTTNSAAAGAATMSSYGTVYAIQQTSVSLAYCLAPLLGGELAQAMGFAWLMRIVGTCNLIYGPVLVYLYRKYDPKLREKQTELLLTNSGRGSSQYKQLYNAIDGE